jgi:hypothetical protein
LRSHQTACGGDRMDYNNVFLEAWRMLGSWLLVFVAYRIAYFNITYMRTTKHFNVVLWNSRLGKVLAYPLTMFWVAIVSLVLWSSYGTSVEGGDPLTGGGEVVTDFESTEKERNEYGLSNLLVLGITGAVAVYRNYKAKPVKKVPMHDIVKGEREKQELR